MGYSKFGAKPTFIDGVRFPSKLEALRYADLKFQERAGLIRDLKLQPKFELQPKYTNANGDKIRAITYVADFSYFDVERGCQVVEDAKGVKTEVYKLKKKLFEFKYPDMIIVEVTR